MAKRPRKLFLKRVRKMVLLFKVKDKQWDNLANLSQFPLIENDLKELVETGFLKKGRIISFILTEKGKKVIEASQYLKKHFQWIFAGYSFEQKPSRNTQKEKKEVMKNGKEKRRNNKD